jgi:hypothetical protein
VLLIFGGTLEERNPIMTRFVHIDYPTRHPGVERFESVIALAARLRHGFNSTRGLSSMLLAAMVSALLVVADQVVDTWADGHLLAAWVLMWVIGFAALAMLAAPSRALMLRVLSAVNLWLMDTSRARADARMWAIAEQDHRVMADLHAAKTRTERLCRLG